MAVARATVPTVSIDVRGNPDPAVYYGGDKPRDRCCHTDHTTALGVYQPRDTVHGQADGGRSRAL
ncbi:hypothetical protein V6O07_11810 [Arthrospira platensis SPKY2]